MPPKPVADIATADRESAAGPAAVQCTRPPLHPIHSPSRKRRKMSELHTGSRQPLQQPLRFGVFELDVRTGELRKRGMRLPIQGLPVQVLGILAQRPGELVTREELRQQLWPPDTFVDFDHSLHNAIARLRDA